MSADLESWQTKIAYLHDNPRRKGLVTAVTLFIGGVLVDEMLGETAVLLSEVVW